MDEIIDRFTEEPIQSLMGYIFDNYCDFEDFCEIAKKPVEVEECVECHRGSYYEKGSPTYECENFKRVYLLRYLATQFAQSAFLIRTYILDDIKGKMDLSVISFGGGPAPEALALVNEIGNRDENYEISFENIDGEASWEPIYYDLTHYFVDQVKNVKLKTSFNCSDVTNFTSSKHYDIVFISWLLSDMDKQNRPRIVELARDLVTPQGHILVTDRVEEAMVDDISTVIGESKGLNLQEHGELHRYWCGVSFPDELKDCFKFRLNSYTAYWLLRITSNDS